MSVESGDSHDGNPIVHSPQLDVTGLNRRVANVMRIVTRRKAVQMAKS